MIGGWAAELGKIRFGSETKSWNHFIVVVIEKDVADSHDGHLVLVWFVGIEEVERSVGCGCAVGSCEVYGH